MQGLADITEKDEALSKITHAQIMWHPISCSSCFQSHVAFRTLPTPWPLESWISPSPGPFLSLLDVDSYPPPAYEVQPGLACSPPTPQGCLIPQALLFAEWQSQPFSSSGRKRYFSPTRPLPTWSHHVKKGGSFLPFTSA